MLAPVQNPGMSLSCSVRRLEDCITAQCIEHGAMALSVVAFVCGVVWLGFH